MRRLGVPLLFVVLTATLLSGPGHSDQLQVAVAGEPKGIPAGVPFISGTENGSAQKATGELIITDLQSQSSFDGATLRVTRLCVQNGRSTAAADVWVEWWVSKQIPQIGGDLTHQTTATYSLGLVPAQSTKCVDAGTLPVTLPDPGYWWISVAVFEGTGSSRKLQYVYTDSTKADLGGPVENGEFFFEKPASYFLTNGGNAASMQVARIRNNYSSAVGPMRLAMWATATPPRWGQTITGTTIAAKELGSIAARGSLSNVDTGSLTVTQPPAGTYWISISLQVRESDGKWYYYCFYTFENRYTFTGATGAPVADFSYSPASPVAGGQVTFTDTSTGGPTSWSWSFGDGATSASRNPTHVYASAGTFNVTLTASSASGSNTKSKSIIVAAPTAPVITFFGANPPAVSPGQQTILSWTSTGGTAASIDQGIGAVPTSGSRTITPVVGVPYTLTVTGPGGSRSATVTVSSVSSGYTGTWLLPSSARSSGANAFWTTDLTVANTGATAATVDLKFLGHSGEGVAGPVRSYSIGAMATRTFPDVLSSVFGRGNDWGPILIRSTSATLVAHGQTWTPSPTGGSYGQSVPAIGPEETIGATARTLAGVWQNARFRTNIVLSNMNEAAAAVTLRVLLADGTTATFHTVTVGGFGFLQLNIANDLGISNLDGGSVVVSSTTSGARIAAYASVIDSATADPRTILAR